MYLQACTAVVVDVEVVEVEVVVGVVVGCIEPEAVVLAFKSQVSPEHILNLSYLALYISPRHSFILEAKFNGRRRPIFCVDTAIKTHFLWLGSCILLKLVVSRKVGIRSTNTN